MMNVAASPSLTINRTLHAPLKKVFSAWTDPARLVRWFGPSDSFRCEVPEFDLRTGGRFTILMHDPDGERHCVSGEYFEIVDNERLVFSWYWESKH